MMVVIHCSNLTDDKECLGYSLENQATTLNVDDYSVIITDNELPDIYSLIDITVFPSFLSFLYGLIVSPFTYGHNVTQSPMQLFMTHFIFDSL